MDGMRRASGLTIIQIMVILFFAGIAGALVVRYLIDQRCEQEPQAKVCQDSRRNK